MPIKPILLPSYRIRGVEFSYQIARIHVGINQISLALPCWAQYC